MVDFLGTFLVLAALVVLLITGFFVYFVAKIIIGVINKEKRKADEILVLENADTICQYLEEKKISNIEELLGCIDLPKKMTLEKENNDFIIKYKELVYSINTGRFKVDF